MTNIKRTIAKKLRSLLYRPGFIHFSKRVLQYLPWLDEEARVLAYRLKTLGRNPLAPYTPAPFSGIPSVDHGTPHQLLYDVSELSLRDHHTGVQRVVRAILQELPAQLPKGYELRLVRVEADGQLLYANAFSRKFFGEHSTIATAADDVPAVAASGDIFLSADLHLFYPMQAIQTLQQGGVRVLFVVYDMVAFTMDTFPKAFRMAFRDWFQGVLQVSDAVITDSRSVADELCAWLEEHPLARTAPLPVSYFHLGADLEASRPTHGLSAKDTALLAQLRGRTVLLMVGTLEPRKGHAHAVAAMEQLWMQGADMHLVIVGKEGWRSHTLVKKLRIHPELHRRLFWLEHASDELLSRLYAQSTALIAASFSEGFGLPLIEAAHHGLPIIARDIAVFREVAGEYAYYFPNNEDPDNLAHAIANWLLLQQQGLAPQSNGMPYLTWAQSAEQLARILTGKDYRIWNPPSSDHSS